ncbi:VOC family protein [Rapidithrix thailandica]|uniref:VOC family protein n=1 Tax=Rapidithrix thailandica TaxID=413964 RepID=A0AAW9SAE5_9BACT
MIFEHFAINVNEPLAVRDWYCEHLELKVAWQMDKPPYMLFLADSTGRVVCELYHRPEFPIIEYGQQHQLTFHFAFESENAEADKNRLLACGASFVEEVKTEDGSHIVMLRDPWGLPLQLCQRTQRLNSVNI